MMARQLESCGLRVLHARQVDAAHVGQCMLSMPAWYSTIAPYLREVTRHEPCA